MAVLVFQKFTVNVAALFFKKVLLYSFSFMQKILITHTYGEFELCYFDD